MSNSDNNTTLVGNLTRDPELRYTQTGNARTVLGLAVNRRWMNRQTNDWEEQVSFFNVVCWQTLAENVAESLRKGNRVVVQGRLEQRSWETPEGEQKNTVEVVADEVAPSLRWATAEVTRNPNGSDANAPVANQPTAPAPQQAAAAPQQTPAQVTEEEPF